MKRFFSRPIQQLLELEDIEFNLNGAATVRKVRQKLVGDCKFESAAYNHAGQAALDGCIQCEMSWSHSGANMAKLGTFPFEQCGRIRTLESMKNNGKDPLFKVEPSDATPPPLHMLMRIVDKYVVPPLYALCNQLDSNSTFIPETWAEQQSELRLLVAEESGRKSVTSSLKKTVELMETLKKCIEKKPTAKSSRCEVAPCSYSNCFVHLLPKKFRDSQIFFCIACSKALHVLCGGLLTEDQRYEALELSAKCIHCKEETILSKENLIEYIDEALENTKEIMARELGDLEELTGDREELENFLKKSKGETRQKLEAALTEIGCDPTVYYHQMNGNQVRFHTIYFYTKLICRFGAFLKRKTSKKF